MQRINGYRYAKGHELIQKTSNPNLLYQNIDYIVSVRNKCEIFRWNSIEYWGFFGHY